MLSDFSSRNFFKQVVPREQGSLGLLVMSQRREEGHQSKAKLWNQLSKATFRETAHVLQATSNPEGGSFWPLFGVTWGLWEINSSTGVTYFISFKWRSIGWTDLDSIISPRTIRAFLSFSLFAVFIIKGPGKWITSPEKLRVDVPAFNIRDTKLAKKRARHTKIDQGIMHHHDCCCID